MKALESALLEELGTTAKIFSTTYQKIDFTLLDVLHPEASKGVGVAAAAAELGVLREAVMAVGDNLNDLEMLHYAGTGVVMANAETSLHEIDGFYATGTNDEDGVAMAVERFILHPEAESAR